MWDENDSSSLVPASLLRVLGLCLVVLAVGLLVAGVLLLVTCTAKTIGSPFPSTVGCAYPFQGDGVAFLYVASLVTILAGNLFARSLEPQPAPKMMAERRYVASALVASIATVLFLVTLLVLGTL